MDSFKPIHWKDIHRTEPCCLALGKFDGVHLGHQKIIRELLACARQRNAKSVVVTYEPHPDHLLRPEDTTHLLTTPREKLEWLHHFGVDQVLFIRFDKAFSQMSAGSFVKELLLKRLKALSIFIGPNHCFGFRAEGNHAFLKKELALFSVGVHAVVPVSVDGKWVSSSRIREAVHDGRIEEANRLLGYSFGFTGTVERGAGRGRHLGFPTANLGVHPTHKMYPRPGVYGGEAVMDEKIRDAVINVGISPTFGEKIPKIEAHILNFNEDIYDKLIRLKLNCFLRNEKTFESAEELTVQIQSDIDNYTKRKKAVQLD